MSTSPTGTGPGHTILKKSLEAPPSGGGNGEAAAEAGFGHSPSLPNRHAKFRDVVEIVEFGKRDQVKTGVHFAHEEQLHDDDEDEYDGVGEDNNDEDDVHTFTTGSECSSVSGDDPVVFFSQDDDKNSERVSATRSDSSTNGTNSPDVRQDERGGSSPLLGDDDAFASNDSVLKNIFSSLSCRNETSTSDSSHEQTTVKHVRLMDRVEVVERCEEDEYS